MDAGAPKFGFKKLLQADEFRHAAMGRGAPPI
jgi:hypothetical protein